MDSEHSQDTNRLDTPGEGSIRDRDLLNEMLETIPFGIYFKDLESRFIRGSRNLAEAFDLDDPAELIGKTDFDFLEESHARGAREDEQRVIRTAQGMDSREEEFTDRCGDVRWVITTKEPLRDHSGAIVGTLGISREITELKQTQARLTEANEQLEKSYEELKAMQKQLIAAEKAAAVGRLAAGLAHEVKNPLAMVRMGVDFLARVSKPGDDESLETVMSSIQEGVDRADEMLRQIQTFAADELVMHREDINEIVQGTLDSVQEQVAAREIRVVTDLSPDLSPISVDKAKISEVLVQILTNAIQANEDGGQVTVTTGTRTLASDEASPDPGNRTGVRLRAGQKVIVVEVADSGPGIASEILPTIFDPFFTTKPTGQGAGLGLTLSAKLMELHGGELRVENLSEGGAKASLLLGMR